MFSGFMIDAWTVASIVAVLAGLVGFFTVLRGAAFAAHAIPSGAFAGAAAASLLGLSTLLGLGVFAMLTALTIGLLGRRGRPDVATALALVLMLALGALFLSFGDEYASHVDSLLFGEVLGISPTAVVPTAVLAVLSAVALAVVYRPLTLSSVLAEVGQARGVSAFAMEMCFLGVLALASALAVPVVGTLLIFSLMLGAPAAARALTARPSLALGLSVALALLIVWGAIAASYASDYPVGFFVGTISAATYAVSRMWAHGRGHLQRTRGAAP
jgi:zinc/manganese transport system permease protein